MHTIATWLHFGAFSPWHVLIGLLGLAAGIGFFGGLTYRRLPDDQDARLAKHDLDSRIARRPTENSPYQEWEEYQVREQHRTRAE